MEERQAQGNAPAALMHPWADLRDCGLLWLINRCVLHPRGFALAIHYDGAGNAAGWALLGDGSEPWAFAMDDEEDDCFRRVQELLAPGPG